MCEEKLKRLKLKNLEASHPRVAGMVQAHRQHIDTVQGRQARTKDIKDNKLAENGAWDK